MADIISGLGPTKNQQLIDQIQTDLTNAQTSAKSSTATTAEGHAYTQTNLNDMAKVQQDITSATQTGDVSALANDVGLLSFHGQTGLAADLAKNLSQMSSTNPTVATQLQNVLGAAQAYFTATQSGSSQAAQNNLSASITALKNSVASLPEDAPAKTMANSLINTYSLYVNPKAVSQNQKLGSLENITGVNLSSILPASAQNSQLVQDANAGKLKSLIAIKDKSGNIQSFVGITNGNPPEPQIYDDYGKLYDSGNTMLQQNPHSLVALPGGAMMLFDQKTGNFDLAGNNAYISSATIAQKQGVSQDGLTPLTTQEWQGMQHDAHQPGTAIFGAVGGTGSEAGDWVMAQLKTASGSSVDANTPFEPGTKKPTIFGRTQWVHALGPAQSEQASFTEDPIANLSESVIDEFFNQPG